MPRWPDHIVRVVFTLLVLLGVVAGVLRSVATDDLITRVELVRARMISSLGVTQPDPERRARIVAVADGKFAAHRAITRIHVLAGAGFFALASLQLVRRVRTRTPKVHRVSGRVAIILAWLSGLTGLFFGLWQPLAGVAEQLIVGVAGLFLLITVSIGFHHIRAGRVAEHREWMLRGTAAALAIASVRIVSIPLDLALTPRGVDLRVVFALSLWVGWSITLAGAEWWIRTTRVRVPGRGQRIFRLALIVALVGLGRPVTAEAQSRLLAPSRHGERVLRGFFLPPTDGPVGSFVAGHALILRDPGGLVSELSQVCMSSRTASDSTRAAVRRRVAALEVRRTKSAWPRFEFGTLPPGAYIAVVWIELHLPPTNGRGPDRVRSHFGVDRAVIAVRTDTAFVMFNTGRPGFRAITELSEALRCLEFLVIPGSATR